MTSICKKIALAKYYHLKHLHFLSVPLFKKVLEALQITKREFPAGSYSRRQEAR